MTGYFFRDPEIKIEMIENNKFVKKMSELERALSLRKTAEILGEIEEWNAENIQAGLNRALEETGRKPAELFSLVRISLSFAEFSPALNLTMEVLGRETSLARIRKVITAISNE